MGKIVPIKMKVRNFLSFGNRFQELYFNKGINIIQGYDDNTGKSNGSGKSSIMDAVCFCLYGKTIKNIKKDKIPNWLNNSKCEVQLTFDIGSDSYVFYRSIKPNKFKVYKNGDMLPILSNIRDFQFKIEQDILGMDFKSFSNLIYFSPNTSVSILDAKKDQKRKFLESLFDLSIYSDMLKECNVQLSSNNQNISLINNDISHLETQLSDINNRLSKTSIVDIKQYQNKLNFDKLTYDGLKKEIDDISFDENQYNEIVSILTSLKDDKKQYDIELIKFKAERTSKKAILDSIDIEGIKNKCTELTKIIETLKSKLEDIDVLNNIKTEKEKSIVELNERLVKINSDINKLKDLLLKVNERLAIYNSKLDEYKKADTLNGITECPVCLQDVDHNMLIGYYDDKINNITTQIDTFISKRDIILDKIKPLQDESKQINVDIQDNKDSILKTEKLIIKNNSTQNTIEHYTKELNDIDDIDTIHLKMDVLFNEIKDIDNKIKETDHKLVMTDTDISIKEDIYNRLDLEKISYEQKNIDLDKLSILIKEKQNNIDNLIKLNNNIQQQFDNDKKSSLEYKNDIKEKTIKIKNINRLIDHIEYLKTSLKDEHIKQYAISSILPFLNKQTNMYLQKSGFPYSVSIDGWLDVKIIGFGVDNVDVSSLSGGEKKSVSLALQFASNDISLLQAKNGFSLMILDEMIDSSFDAVSLINIMEIIKVKQQETDSCVYIITHKDEVKEFDFDNTIMINKKNGYSIIN